MKSVVCKFTVIVNFTVSLSHSPQDKAHFKIDYVWVIFCLYNMAKTFRYYTCHQLLLFCFALPLCLHCCCVFIWIISLLKKHFRLVYSNVTWIFYIQNVHVLYQFVIENLIFVFLWRKKYLFPVKLNFIIR